MMFSKDNLPMAVSTFFVLLIVFFVGPTCLAYLETITTQTSPSAFAQAKRARFMIMAGLVLTGGWGALTVLPMLFYILTH